MKRAIRYGDDLAFIHAAGFAGLAQAAARLLVRECRRRRIRSGLVVDVGCGEGSLSGRLSAAGYDVLGIDASPAMIRLARRRWPRARFRVGHFEALRPPPCVAIAAVGEVLSYAFAPRASWAALRRFLGRAYASLQPGGLLLFDVIETTPRPERRESWREDAGGAWAVLLRVRERGGLLRREIASYRRVGRLYRRSHEVHVQRRLPRRALLSALRATGFRVRVLAGYGRARLRPGGAAFLAVKPLSAAAASSAAAATR